MPVSSSRPTESNTYYMVGSLTLSRTLRTVYKSFVLWPPRQFMVIVIFYIRDRSEMATKTANESWVWRHMEQLNGNKAQCTLCSKQLTCVGGSTSGVRHHLTSMHPDVMSSGNPALQPSVASFCVGPRQCNDTWQEKITSI